MSDAERLAAFAQMEEWKKAEAETARKKAEEEEIARKEAEKQSKIEALSKEIASDFIKNAQHEKDGKKTWKNAKSVAGLVSETLIPELARLRIEVEELKKRPVAVAGGKAKAEKGKKKEKVVEKV